MHMLDIVVEYVGKVLLAGGDEAEMVSKDYVLAEFTLNDKVILCIWSDMHSSQGVQHG